MNKYIFRTSLVWFAILAGYRGHMVLPASFHEAAANDGMITSTIHVLILVPVFFVMVKERALKRGTLLH